MNFRSKSRDAVYHRKLYKENPAYRARAIKKGQEAWARLKKDPIRLEIKTLTNKIWWRRQQIEKREEEIKKFDNEIIEYTLRREKLRRLHN